VGVKRTTDKRMQLDRLSFNQGRQEGLDTETVQRGRTVQHHRMFFNNFVKGLENIFLFGLDALLRRLDVRSKVKIDKALHDERLEKLKRHLLRKAHLMDLQLRPDDD